MLLAGAAAFANFLACCGATSAFFLRRAARREEEGSRGKGKGKKTDHRELDRLGDYESSGLERPAAYLLN